MKGQLLSELCCSSYSGEGVAFISLHLFYFALVCVVFQLQKEQNIFLPLELLRNLNNDDL